jgi:integrase/recombinase XerD
MRLSTVIHQFFDKYLPHIKGVSPNSIKAYRDTFKLFLPFAANRYGIKVGSLSVHHLTPEVILSFLDHLESERKNSARTRNHRLAAIKSLAKMIRFTHPQWSASMDKIVIIPQKRTQRQLVGFLYPEEIHQVLNTVNIDTAVGFRDYTILHLLFETGARASEMARLNLDYFNSEQGSLAILGKGNRFRQVDLSPTTVKMIKAYTINHRRRPKPAYAKRLFISQHGKALTRHGIYRLCRKYLRMALSKKRTESSQSGSQLSSLLRYQHAGGRMFGDRHQKPFGPRGCTIQHGLSANGSAAPEENPGAVYSLHPSCIKP